MGRMPIKVGCYDVNGNFLAEFESGRKAADSIGVNHCNIHMAIRNGCKCGGFYWVNITNFKPLKIEAKHYRRGGKKINIYRRPKILIKQAQTFTEAQDITGLSHSSIRSYARRGIWYTGDHGEYFFEFVNPEDAYNQRANYAGYKAAAKRQWKRPVVLIKDSKRHEYESVMDAARDLNINEKSIRNVLAGRWTRAGGYLVEKIGA